MKLFLIIYTGTQIGGVIGPLPITEAQCLDHAGKLNAESALIVKTGKNAKGEAIPEKNRKLIATFRAACEWHDQRPELKLPA